MREGEHSFIEVHDVTTLIVKWLWETNGMDVIMLCYGLKQQVLFITHTALLSTLQPLPLSLAHSRRKKFS